MNSDNTSGIALPMKFVSLRVTGPTLLYFYSDMAIEEQGFLIEYWYVVYIQVADAAVCVVLCVLWEVLVMYGVVVLSYSHDSYHFVC